MAHASPRIGRERPDIMHGWIDIAHRHSCMMKELVFVTQGLLCAMSGRLCIASQRRVHGNGR
jgi:hypothetical protein